MGAPRTGRREIVLTQVSGVNFRQSWPTRRRLGPLPTTTQLSFFAATASAVHVDSDAGGSGRREGAKNFSAPAAPGRRHTLGTRT